MTVPLTRDFHLPGRSAVYAERGMVATSHPVAVNAGLAMLREGGNAVDAALAAALTLGVAEPAMTGLGGDMFALVHLPDGTIRGLNASGRGPSGLSAAALRAEGHEVMPDRSPHAVTIPCAVEGFCALSEELGRLGLHQVAAPAIEAYETGVRVAPRAAFDWGLFAGDLQGDARDHYLVNGAPPVAGDLFALPAQAEVLRRIARHGRAAFYEGEVAEDMVESLRALGGTHTMEDFAANACEWVEPISGRYGGVDLVELPPNGQGATAILLAKILGRFDMAALDPFGAERAHLEAEASKLAYDARNRFIADPSHAAIRMSYMTSDATAKALAALIDRDRAMANPAALTEQVHKDTVYLTAADGDGMAVSLIYSVYKDFGSGLASSKFGIGFQNRGAGFNLIEGHPNEAGPGKRPMHTIIPAMVTRDGRLEMSFGVMGGPYQPCGHVRVLSNLEDHGMDLQAALDAPRCFYDTGGAMGVERGYSDAVRAGLEAKGHRLVTPQAPIGGAQAIRFDHARGVMIGASDPRKDGLALGF